MIDDKEDFYLQQLKQDLRDLKKYIEEFLFFLPIPVCSVNPMSVMVDANRMFYDVTGYKKGVEIKGETIFRIEHLFEDKKKWQKLEKRILKKELIKGEEMVIITKDEKRIPVSLSASWREDENRVLIGYFLAFIDISEIKTLQENLEKKVEERTKELQKRIEELEKFHKLTVGRELKMIELKKKIKELEKVENPKVINNNNQQ